MDELDIWRLAEELTIVQAAVLLAGDGDPAVTAHYVEGWDVEKRPRGYEAAKVALVGALRSQRIKGIVREEARLQRGSNLDEPSRFVAEPGTVDVNTSTLDVQSLKDWLKDRGIAHGFFFPAGLPAADFLDFDHPRYAPKLAAAVQAWRAVSDPELVRSRSPKQAILKWLREHASEYRMTADDGTPAETSIEEVAKVANWAPGGGAPRTGG